MQIVYVMKGAPASGKSTFCKELMENEPGKWKRINNDSLRLAFDFGVWSKGNEKLVKQSREYLLKEFLLAGYNVLIDNVNANKTHTSEVIKVAANLNIDVTVTEKPFYIDLETAIDRDSKREGIAKVGPDVIKRFYKALGGKSFKGYVGVERVFNKRVIEKVIQDTNLHKGIVCDIDGTYALLGNRSPYNPQVSLYTDSPNIPVVNAVRRYYNAGYEVIFCSGREDKYEQVTRDFINKYSEGLVYKLFMRKTGDKRGDDIVKEEIFMNEIKDKCLIEVVLDDRSRVVQRWRDIGLTVFQVAPGDF
jgi:predicted kinase